MALILENKKKYIKIIGFTAYNSFDIKIIIFIFH